MQDEKTKQIAVRLPMELIRFLENEARKDERTVAWLARKILMDRMKATRGLPKKQRSK